VLAVSRHPDRLGLGIDEDTAVVVRGDAFEVIGKGTVTLVDGRLAGRSAISPPPPGDDAIVVRAARLDVLASGQRAKLGPAILAEQPRSRSSVSAAQLR